MGSKIPIVTYLEVPYLYFELLNAITYYLKLIGRKKWGTSR